jgi:hypothetical protein
MIFLFTSREIGHLSMHPDEHNPYASPAAPQMVEGPDDDFRALRAKTNLHWQISLQALLIPAAANYWFFDQLVRLPNIDPPEMNIGLRLFDAMYLIPLVAVLLFAGLSLLEWIAGVIRYLFARSVPRQLWLASMYRSLSHLIPVAILANTLWMVWLVGFYLLEMNFFVISIPVGILAHILGASLYVRIFYGWFRLTRETPAAD